MNLLCYCLPALFSRTGGSFLSATTKTVCGPGTSCIRPPGTERRRVGQRMSWHFSGATFPPAWQWLPAETTMEHRPLPEERSVHGTERIRRRHRGRSGRLVQRLPAWWCLHLSSGAIFFVGHFFFVFRYHLLGFWSIGVIFLLWNAFEFECSRLNVIVNVSIWGIERIDTTERQNRQI